MNLGNNLFNARKKSGLSQEDVAEKLGVSRQTVSKWETDETVPDIRQSKKMAVLYNMTLDELIDFDLDIREIQEAIDRTSEEKEHVDISRYVGRLEEMLDEIVQKYGFNQQDAMLVLKDILYNVWKIRKDL